MVEPLVQPLHNMASHWKLSDVGRHLAGMPEGPTFKPSAPSLGGQRCRSPYPARPGWLVVIYKFVI